MKDIGNIKIGMLLFVMFICSIQLFGQYFINGQEPASVKWQQIKTRDFQIIYPTNYTEQAQYYINVLKLSQPAINASYQSNLKRISIILHNNTTTSNAMVPIAPLRAEFYEMPSQYIYPQIWQDQLTLHEYRHVVQINKMRQGMTKGLYYVFGEQGIALVMGLWVPFWFIEGDAVYSETILSNSGRGRVPEFIYTLKAQVLDKKIYKYDKASFGSFRDFVPDHYSLGYQLVAKGIENHGIEMWNYTLDRVARRPYYLVPFTTAVKKQTGKFKVQFYNSIMKSLKTEWWIEDNPDIDREIEFVSPEQKFYTSYLFPHKLKNGSVIAEKKGLDDINRFVLIDSTGTEVRLFTPGYDFYESLSVSGNTICWNEKTYDPRWEMRNYSVIKLYDFESGEKKQLTRKSRYFAPALSSKQDKVVAVHVDHQSKYELHILDADSGKVIETISTDDNLFFTTPHWSDDDQYIVAIVLGKKGKSLVKIDTKSWEMEYMLPFSYKEIKWPAMHGKWIVYSGTYEGKDNLYAINTDSDQIYEVFESRFGATNASFSENGEQLVFSYYTADGFKIASLDFRPEQLEEVDLNLLDYQYLADRIVPENAFNLDDTIVPETVYPTKKYSKAGHLFNIHSWMPLAVDVDNYTVNPGITLLSQNVISTTVARLDYLYDINEQTSKIAFGMDYYGWYPVIGFSVDYGGRSTSFLSEDGETVNLRWRETDLSLRVSLPLNLTNSKWAKGIRPSVGMDQKFLKMDQNSAYEFSETQFTSPIYQFYAYNQYKTSLKDLYPKWGQIVNLVYRHTPWADTANSQLALIGYLYFPGFVKHQGIKIYGGYQKTVSGNYSYSNLVAVPRGYTNVNYPKYFSIRSDYAFPIAYPDWDVPGAFYLKRIYSKIFYDYMQGYQGNQVTDLSSTGIEVYTDWNFFSILVNVELGIRVSQLIPSNTQSYEFLFGFSVNY
jgi:hypothetical protein